MRHVRRNAVLVLGLPLAAGLAACGGGSGVALPAGSGVPTVRSSLSGLATSPVAPSSASGTSTGAPGMTTTPSPSTDAQRQAAVIADWDRYLAATDRILGTTNRGTAAAAIAAVSTGGEAVTQLRNWVSAQQQHEILKGDPVALTTRVTQLAPTTATVLSCVDESAQYTYDTRTGKMTATSAARYRAHTRTPPDSETAQLDLEPGGHWKVALLGIGRAGSCSA